MYMLLHKPYLVKWSTNEGKGSKMSKKMSTWFMTQIIAFRDVTAKFYDMGLRFHLKLTLSFPDTLTMRKLRCILPANEKKRLGLEK